MQALNILSGLAVLFTTLAYAHLVHHFSSYAFHQDPTSVSFWAGLALAVAAGIFSFIGGALLIRCGR